MKMLRFVCIGLDWILDLVLAFLGPAMRERIAYNIGGSFNLTITADGGTLLGTFNGASYDPAARKELAFGRPSIVMIEIPKSER